VVAKLSESAAGLNRYVPRARTPCCDTSPRRAGSHPGSSGAGLPYVRKPYNKSIARVIEQAVGGPAVPAAMSASEREELVPRPRMVHPQQGRGSF